MLAHLKREGGAFHLAAAKRLWWQQYVPLLHVVSVTGLPMTAAADRLAQEDLSDVGILQLAGVLAPVVLFAEDPDLIRQGIAVPGWRDVRAVLGRIGRAEDGTEAGSTMVTGTGYGLYGAARLTRAYPVAAGIVAAAAGVYAYRNRSRFTADTRAKLARRASEALRVLTEPYGQYELHKPGWTRAERGTAGDDVLSQVARLLARAPVPMTRTEILAALACVGADAAPPADGRTGTAPAPLPRLPSSGARQMAVGPDQRPGAAPAMRAARADSAPAARYRRRQRRGIVATAPCCPYDDRVTARRALGAGPQAPQNIRAAQADLLDVLPGVRLPDLDQMRARGVLGSHPATPPAPRRTLGTGGSADADPLHLS